MKYCPKGEKQATILSFGKKWIKTLIENYKHFWSIFFFFFKLIKLKIIYRYVFNFLRGFLLLKNNQIFGRKLFFFVGN